MPTTRTKPSVPTNLFDYYQTTHDIFRKQWEKLTPSIPHAGERGRNDEERVKQLLAKMLPKKFSLGTGFIASPQSGNPLSPQTDIIVYDEFYNAPLFNELSSLVLPAEAVYATIEVKTYLTNAELHKAVKNLGATREMSHKRYYISYGARDGAVVRRPGKYAIAPRSYIVAYDARVKTPTQLAIKLTQAVSKRPAFLHGVFIIKQGWYFEQKYQSTQFRERTSNALFWFITNMREAIQPLLSAPAWIEAYIPDPEIRKRFEAVTKDTVKDVPG